MLQVLRQPDLYLTLGIRQVVPVVTKVGIAPQVTLQQIGILCAIRDGGFQQEKPWLILLGSGVLISVSQLFQGLVKPDSRRFRSRRLEPPIQTREVVPFFASSWVNISHSCGSGVCTGTHSR